MINIPLNKILFLDIETVGIEPTWEDLCMNRPELSFQFEKYLFLLFRRISLAYSCISLADVAKKLRLDSPKDAEYIIAKVRDRFPQLEIHWKFILNLVNFIATATQFESVCIYSIFDNFVQWI